jgi:hypothetical protein
MNGRTIARWIAGLTVVGAGVTMLRELAEWEWHRALVAGTFTLIAEVALATSLILDRMAKMPSAAVPTPSTAEREERFTARLGGAREHRDHFAWMRDPSRVGVFVPLLMGAGVLMSGLAWLVERVSSRSTGRIADRRLARRIARVLPEAGPLVPRRAQLDHPALVPMLAPRPRART